jgi:hypothetical protein
MRHGFAVQRYGGYITVVDRRLNVELARFDTYEQAGTWLASYAECGLKRRFTSKHAADRAKKRIRRQGGPAMRRYRCPQCDSYHLTKKVDQAALPSDVRDHP